MKQSRERSREESDGEESRAEMLHGAVRSREQRKRSVAYNKGERRRGRRAQELRKRKWEIEQSKR
jgi:hypothetical protein